MTTLRKPTLEELYKKKADSDMADFRWKFPCSSHVGFIQGDLIWVDLDLTDIDFKDWNLDNSIFCNCDLTNANLGKDFLMTFINCNLKGATVSKNRWNRFINCTF